MGHKGHALVGPGCWARMRDVPVPSSPRSRGPGSAPPIQGPHRPALVSLTPSGLWDMGSGSVPWEQQPYVTSGATGTWKDTYHQHAIGDEGLRWKGTGKQNENF